MVNRIRSRAGVPAISEEEKDPQKFQECIADERRKELASEGIRWHDLVRRNKYIEAVTNRFKEHAYDSNGTLVRPILLDYISRVTKGTYLYPIPDPQMKIREGLYTQNEAYR